MNTQLQERPARDRTQEFLDLLAHAQRRETELETAYTDGRASAAQLAELEQLRIEIEDALSAVDDMGYFNPS